MEKLIECKNDLFKKDELIYNTLKNYFKKGLYKECIFLCDSYIYKIKRKFFFYFSSYKLKIKCYEKLKNFSMAFLTCKMLIKQTEGILESLLICVNFLYRNKKYNIILKFHPLIEKKLLEFSQKQMNLKLKKKISLYYKYYFNTSN